MEQVASVVPCVLTEGRANGTRALLVSAPSGLDVTLLPDRGMDIGAARYRGVPLAWVSPVGVVHPASFQDHDWLRSFHGGLLTTCGVSNVGPAAAVRGQLEPMHGRFSNIPADNVSWSVTATDDGPEIVASATVRETTVYGSNIAVHRTVTLPAGSAAVHVSDRVVNEGWSDHDLMLLYHVNVGYPLLDDHAELVAGSGATVPLNAAARAAHGSEKRFSAPVIGAEPEVFSHEVSVGRNSVAVWNDSVQGGPGLGLAVEFAADELPYLLQWRMPGEGTYVMGLEPSTTLGQGYEAERKAGRTDVVRPGEQRHFSITVRVLHVRPEEQA
jgi:hypothetical protein